MAEMVLNMSPGGSDNKAEASVESVHWRHIVHRIGHTNLLGIYHVLAQQFLTYTRQITKLYSATTECCLVVVKEARRLEELFPGLTERISLGHITQHNSQPQTFYLWSLLI